MHLQSQDQSPWIGTVNRARLLQIYGEGREGQSMRGVIRRYFADRGFGFIYDPDGNNYFFHVNDVESPELPEVGARVEFEVEDDPKGPKAVRVRLILNACPAFVQVGENVIKTSTIEGYGIAYRTCTELIEHPAIAKDGPVEREFKYEVAFVKTRDGRSYIVDELDGDEPVGDVITRLNAIFEVDNTARTPLLDAEKQRALEMSHRIEEYEREGEEFEASWKGKAVRAAKMTMAVLFIVEDLLEY